LIDSLAISPDGSFIATASRDNTVRLWRTETHRQIGEALQHSTWFFCVAISPNGEMLVSGEWWGKRSALAQKDRDDVSFYLHHFTLV